MRPAKTRHILKRSAIAVACALACALGAGAAWALNQQPNYDWYTANPNADTFTLSRGADLRGLADLVNGTASVDMDGDGTDDEVPAVDFAGKTVTLGGVGIYLANEEFTPIGTEQHPFQGAFDGDEVPIAQLFVTQGTRNVGLFGYCGPKSELRNVQVINLGASASQIVLSDESEDAAAPEDVIRDVGSLVGHTDGAMRNCSSTATVTVRSKRASTNDVPLVAANIGGLAGSSDGDIAGCTYAGDLEVEAPSLASDAQDAVVANVGGIVGMFGHADADGRTSAAGSITDCAFGDAQLGIGQVQPVIHVQTTGVGGLDRFGVQKEACSQAVGGIAGYSFGGIASCTNYGLVNTNSQPAWLFARSDGKTLIVDKQDILGMTPAQQRSYAYPEPEDYFKLANGASAAGGIAGTVRAAGLAPDGTAIADTGSSDAAIQVADCFNVGAVVGLARVGGIVGTAGSHAAIDRCRNGRIDTSDGGNKGAGMNDDSGHIVSTRWNKPMTGGIAGTTSSNVSNCANLAEIENIQTGYYTAGIVGGVSSTYDYTTEVYACFNSGQVHVSSHATSTYREAGLVGNNGGYLHDCVMRSGSVLAHDDDALSYPNAAIGDDNWGMWANVTFAKTADLRKSESCAVLNGAHERDVLNLPESDWVYWYNLDGGYPTLNVWDSPDAEGRTRTQLSADVVEASCVEFAEYAGDEEAIPKLVVTYIKNKGARNEERIALVQNVDFYAIPQKGACAISSEAADPKPYSASIVGIGNYKGKVSDVCMYGIGPCDLKSCDVSTDGKKYNFGVPVYPSEVYVLNPAGARIDPSEYRYQIYDRNTYSLTTASTKSYVVFDSDGFVSWDGGATRQPVSDQAAHAKLSGDLTGVDFVLYDAGGMEIYRFADDVGKVIDPDNGKAVESKLVRGPEVYKGAQEGVADGGLPGYIVKVSAHDKASSIKAESWASGQFLVDAIDLNNECAIEKVEVDVPSADGSDTSKETWYWDREKSQLYEMDDDGNPVCNEDGSLKRASIDFTGAEVHPDVTVTYTKVDDEGNPVGDSIEVEQSRSGYGYYTVFGDPHTTKEDLPYVNRGATPRVVADGYAQNALADANRDLKGNEKAALVVKATASHCFSNYLNLYFTINPVSIDDCEVLISGGEAAAVPASFAYRDGYGVRPTVDLVRCGNKLIGDTDYTVTYSNNVNITPQEVLDAFDQVDLSSQESIDEFVETYKDQLASYTIAGKGNVTGSYTGYFFIETGRSINEMGLSIAGLDKVQYNFDKPAQPYGGVKLVDADGNDSGLVEGKDYVVTYKDNVKVGASASAYVQGVNGYSGLLADLFTIVPFDMNDPENAWRIEDLSYSKEEWATRGVPVGYTYSALKRRVHPVVDWETMKVVDDDYWNVGGRVFTFTNKSTGNTIQWDFDDPHNMNKSYPTEVPPGDYTLVIRYGSPLVGVDTCEITVVKMDLAEYAAEHPFLFKMEAQTYDGSTHEPYVSNRFQVSYEDNVNPGIAKCTVTASEDDSLYYGSFVGTFPIAKLDVSKAEITVHDQLYRNGRAITPAVQVAYNGHVYEQDVDYTVKYAENTAKGQATIIVTGIGNCEGVAEAHFRIGDTLNIAQGEVEPIADQVKTGQVVEPKPVVTYEGALLTEGKDYELAYSDNVEVTKENKPATVTIKGLGTYRNSQTTATFNIVEKRDIAAATCEIPAQRFTGNPIEPALTVTYAGGELREGVDYTVAYRRNVKAGSSARAVVTGAGSYSGTLVAPFRIVVADGSFGQFGQDASNAVDFALAAARDQYPDGAEGVILAWQHDAASQIAAAPLSRAMGWPMLPVSKGDLSAKVLSYAREAGVMRVLAIGDAASLFDEVNRVLPAVEWEAVQADDAVALSLLLADKQQQVLDAGTRGKLAVLVNPADVEVASCAATYASWAGAPVLLASEDGTISESIGRYLGGFDQVLVAGGVFSVDVSVDDLLASSSSVNRIAGSSWQKTCEKLVAYCLPQGFSADGALVVATPSLRAQLPAITLAAARGVPFVPVSSSGCDAAHPLSDDDAPAYGAILAGGYSAFGEELMSAAAIALGWEK